MNPFKQYAEKLTLKAHRALLLKHPSDANRFAKKALNLDASIEDAWLVLAATSIPEESRIYLKKVLDLNPNNEKAIKALEWIREKQAEKNESASHFFASDQALDAINQEINFKKINSKSLFQRISSRWQSIFALICILLILITAAAAPLLAPASGSESAPWFKIVCNRLSCYPEAPNEISPLGTVKEFDVYHTLIWGVRQSLIFGLAAAFISAIIGTLIGTLAAYTGGWFDRLAMRICDAFLAFPIVAAVALFAQLGVLLTASAKGFYQHQLVAVQENYNILQTLVMKADPILIALILFSWMPFARMMHSQVLQIKKSEFVEAAHAVGSSHRRIIFRHILPNALSPVIVLATRDIGRMVVLQSSLTFIGIGDSSAWATLLNLGKDWIIGPGGNLLTRWWIYLPITLALVFFGVTWGILGDELNHWMNPKNA